MTGLLVALSVGHKQHLDLNNLLYLVVPIVAGLIIGGLITWRRRRPKPMEAGMDSFHRGLRALAPAQDLASRNVRTYEAGGAAHLNEEPPAYGRPRPRGNQRPRGKETGAQSG
jgi:hypothetical protein